MFLQDVIDLHKLVVRSIDREPLPLDAYRGRVALVVNTASECGYTPQYAGLEALHRAYKDRGFSVLGFPSNDFGAQEPGREEDIQQFCRTRYDVTFPLFEKVRTKDGKVRAAFESGVAPDDPKLRAAIETALAE